MSKMFLTYLLALLSSLFLLPGSLAEHGGKLKHMHHHRRHEVAAAPAAIEPRRIPAEFDGLQWDEDTRHNFHNKNHHNHIHTKDVHKLAAPAPAVSTTYVVVWKTVWVYPHPVHHHSKTRTKNHTKVHSTVDGETSTLVTSTTQLHFSLAPTESAKESSTTVTTSSIITNSSSIANSSSITNSSVIANASSSAIFSVPAKPSSVSLHTTSTLTSIVTSTISSIVHAVHSSSVSFVSVSSSSVALASSLPAPVVEKSSTAVVKEEPKSTHVAHVSSAPSTISFSASTPPEASTAKSVAIASSIPSSLAIVQASSIPQPSSTGDVESSPSSSVAAASSAPIVESTSVVSSSSSAVQFSKSTKTHADKTKSSIVETLTRPSTSSVVAPSSISSQSHTVTIESSIVASPSKSSKSSVVASSKSSVIVSLSKSSKSSVVASSSSPTHTYTGTRSYPASALTPTATFSLIHGAAKNSPASQYIKCAAQTASLPKLPVNVLASVNNPSFQSDSPIFNGSGTLTLDAAYTELLEDLDTVPFMNRDGGHGGVIGGHKIFYFADTSTFTTPSADKEGVWTGFVSNSIAFDVGNNAFDGKPLTLRDPVGAFSNNMGTQRNFVPFTEDEAAWSSGNGWRKRIAVWPWGSLVPLTNETSALYAPIVIQDNDADPNFRSGGTTLVTISMTPDGQPIVERPVPGLFGAAETQYGVYGGVRSWGPSGVGGTDGKVYVMGTHNNGLLLARTDASSVTDHSSYEYWNNETVPATWASTPSKTSFFMHGAYSSGNIFYSPKHGTFLSVGQNPYTDSKFYYQYLMAPHFIHPSEAGEAYVDIVESICKYPWSNAILLFDTPVLAPGHYTYDGGVHQGYFDDMDIVNGGNRMLLAWTAPTGKPAGSLAGGYQIWTAEVRWG